MSQLRMMMNILFDDLISAVNYLHGTNTQDQTTELPFYGLKTSEISNLDVEIMLYVTDTMGLLGDNYINWKNSCNL
jgi:hypothetical protein